MLIGTGSEVQLAVQARERLQADGIPTRVVSMPCREWFDEQDQSYRDEVLPPSVTARVSVEAGSSPPPMTRPSCAYLGISLSVIAPLR